MNRDSIVFFFHLYRCRGVQRDKSQTQNNNEFAIRPVARHGNANSIQNPSTQWRSQDLFGWATGVPK